MANLVAEFLRPNPLRPALRSSTAPLATDFSNKPYPKIVPFRSDLKADYAQALAGAALHTRARDGAEEQKDAQNAIRGAPTAIGPRNSPLWLVLAILRARSSPIDPLIRRSLKMSYLTGLNQSHLIPIRLNVATSNNSLTDSDLGELARADVRALLTQLPDGRKELLGDYQRASEVGKNSWRKPQRQSDRNLPPPCVTRNS